MSRRSKGPRLYFRGARHDSKGQLTHAGAWVIRDGSVESSTGFGLKQVEEAGEALTDYLVGKHKIKVSSGARDPSGVLIDDVLLKYVADIVTPSARRPGHSRPHETKSRIEFLLRFWGGRLLTEINGAECRAYADQRSSESAARRELEDLRSAINHHRKEGLHDRIISVVLPPKSLPRQAWFEREQAAAAIRAAWRYKELQKGVETDKRPRRHVAHFMVFARYMGSRPGVICATSIEPQRPKGRPWCDLRHGVFYGLPEGQRATKKRRQQVRIPPPLLAHLRRWRALGHRYVVEWRNEPVERITKAHDAAMRDAGLTAAFTPHIWRHTVATWLMQHGASPWKAADFLAMSVETLLRTYGHHRPGDSDAAHGALKSKPVLTAPVSPQI